MGDITLKDYCNKENLQQCECGNYAHYKYLTYDDDGHSTCPACQISYMGSVIKKLKEVIREIADPELSRDDVNIIVKRKYCEIYGISDIDDIDDQFNVDIWDDQ